MTNHSDRERPKILVVDDETVIAVDLESRLERLGYSVCGLAASGEKGLEIIDGERPDLVVMDIALAGEMDGIEAAGIIRETWNIPVIFSTAHADAARLERASLTYPFGYLLKPIREKDLRVAVEIALYVSRIEEERRAEHEAVQVYKNDLDTYFRLTPLGLITFDNDFNIVAWNPGAEKMFGYTAGEAVGRNTFDILVPGYEQKQVREIHQLDEPKVTVNTNDNLTKDGRIITVEWFNSPRLDPHGNLIGLTAACRDITDRIRTEKALQESEERFALAMEATKEGLWDWDVAADRVYYSPAYAAMLGYEADEAGDSPDFWRNRIHPDDRSAALAANLDCIENRRDDFAMEFRMQTRDGEWRWILGRSKAVQRGADGRALRMVGTHTDITEHKQVEEEREKLRTELQQAQKMEAVGKLAGGVAHDFNNLLQAINGYTQIMMMDRSPDDPDYRNLKAVMDAGERAADLVRQLLLFSRRTEPQRTIVELNREVEGALRILERTIPKMIDIQVRLGGRLRPVKVDTVQIEQVLLNLAANAADAMPEGGRLLIETENAALDEEFTGGHPGSAAGEYVLLLVSDTGHGMDQETAERVFEPFFTTKEVGRGTGLGLASVYGIVKNHNGYITCDSAPGRGTSFRIYLPAADRAAEIPAAETGPSPIRGGTETIMLVDDEESVRDFARQVLERFGYTVLTAADGEEALAAYQNRLGDVDLIVLDIGMPGMGGYRCLVELKRVDPSARILVASGYSADAQVREVLEAGATAYVGKPYQVFDLLESVRSALDA